MTKLFLKILLNKKNDASFNYQYRQYYKTKTTGTVASLALSRSKYYVSNV